MATKNQDKKKAPPTPKHVETAANIRRDVGMGNPVTGLATKPVSGLSLTYDEAMKNAQVHMGQAMQNLTAAVAMKDLTPAQLGSVYAYTKSTEDAVKEAVKLARMRSLDAILKHGEVVGDKGLSRELDLGGGLIQRATIQKSGTDPKKFEAALRAKNVPVMNYMGTETKYVLRDGTESQDKALADNVFSPDELKALDYEPDYRLDRPKQGKDS